MNPVIEQIKIIQRDAIELARRAETALKDLEEHAGYSRELAAAPNRLNKSEFARLCGVSNQTVYRWIELGRIKFSSTGLISKEAAKVFIKQALTKRARQLGIIMD